MGIAIKKKAKIKAKGPVKAKKRVAQEKRLPYLGDDPFFVKKADKARAQLVKSGLLNP